jgi:hypothetical protein
MQELTVKELAAAVNLCTIAHITVLVVAHFASYVKEFKKNGLSKVSFRIYNFVKPYIFLLKTNHFT